MSLWWQLYWPYLAVVALPVATAVIAWVARGWWDKAGRVIEDAHTEAQQRTSGVVTDEEWAQIENLANGGGK